MAGLVVSDFMESEFNDVEDGEIVEDKETIILNNTEEEKKNSRAKRFGLVEDASMSKVQDPKIIKLYKRMNVDNNTRLEALNLLGTDSMKTEDVFAIFPGYTPASVEWLTDRTCNAVWLDQESCANALLNCSVRIKGQNSQESDDSEEDSINIEDVRCALPRGRIWRRTRATQLAPNLLMSFAKYFDRRGVGLSPHISHDVIKKNIVFLDEGDEVAKKCRSDTGNPWSDLAREWSYYEMRSAVKKQTDRLPVRDARELISGRVPRINDNPPSPGNGSGTLSCKVDVSSENLDDLDEDINYFDEDVDEEEENDDSKRSIDSRNLIGRGMQADIEEKKILSKKFNTRFEQSRSGIDLRQKLSSKRSRHYASDTSSEESSEKLKFCKHKHSKRKKVEKKWEEPISSEEDDDETLQSSSNSSSHSGRDLRSKLGKHSNTKDKVTRRQGSLVLTQKTKKFVPDMPLQIEIDNDIYFERNRDN